MHLFLSQSQILPLGCLGSKDLEKWEMTCPPAPCYRPCCTLSGISTQPLKTPVVSRTSGCCQRAGEVSSDTSGCHGGKEPSTGNHPNQFHKVSRTMRGLGGTRSPRKGLVPFCVERKHLPLSKARGREKLCCMEKLPIGKVTGDMLPP